ncbi:hypothetical protein HOY80DRAFT_1011078 [Tuber brumale]|nr:hypothetical protein HOY80DRAFT_1011078 [Tuber brumale]
MADTEETGDEDDAWISVNKGKGKEREIETNDYIPTSRAVNKGVKMVIGGWKSTPELAHEEENTATVRKTIGKIGKIGGRKMGQGENIMVEDGKGAPSGSALRVPTPPLIPPEEGVKAAEEEEDEDEKADRKRRQLQKELEAKKKVPVKKKRKF